MLCRRVRLYSTLEAPGLIMLAQRLLFALCSQVTSPSATFLGSNKGQEHKGQGAPPLHAGGVLFLHTYVPVLQDFYDKHYSPTPPQHTASWFPAPLSAQHILIVSKPFGKSTACWVSEATDTPCHLPHRDSRSTMLIFIMKKPEKNQS